MAHFNLKISVAAFVMASLLGLVGCSGDNSEIFPPGIQEAAGSAGEAGGSNVQPPSAGGSSGSTSSGGSAGSPATCVPGLGCDKDEAVCDSDQGQLTCFCGMWTTPAMRDKMECGGRAGAGGSSGSGGSTSTGGSGGNSNVGGSGGSTSTGGSSGSGGTSEVTPPDAGTSGSGGSTSTGGSGGNSNVGGSGGTEVDPPDAGTDAAGGSTSTGGSGGNSNVGGSGGSTSTGGSSGSGGSNGSGTLEIVIVPPTSGQHSIKAYVQALAPKPGEPDWNTEHAADGTRLSFSVTAYAGSGFDMNGYYDPPSSDNLWQNQFCDKVSGKPTVAVMAKFNGQPVGTPVVVDNNANGCNLRFYATPLTSSANDQDGDGEPNGQGLDCDDSDAFVHHGAVETPDDQVDHDCDGSVNPLHVFYRLIIGQSSYVPKFFDWSHNGKVYQMAWNSAGYYEVGIEKPIAAREFVIQYASNLWNVGAKNGSCEDSATVKAYLEQFNTEYTVSWLHFNASGNLPETCHSVLTNFQP